ncbi:unnamed protein product, partial [Phaeothamnion confervicola]
IAWVAASIGAGALVAFTPYALLIPVGVVALGLALHPLGRLVLFTGGALIAFGREGGVSGIELAFFAVSSVIASIAMVRVSGGAASEKESWAPQLLSARLFAVIALGALVVGLVRGAPLIDALRDSVPYVLIPQAIAIGLDAARSTSRRHLAILMWCVVIFSSASNFIATLVRRGVTDLSAPTLLLGSQAIVALGV